MQNVCDCDGSGVIENKMTFVANWAVNFFGSAALQKISRKFSRTVDHETEKAIFKKWAIN